MPEIKTEPVKLEDEWIAFGPDHTLSDIARWLLENESDAETVRDLLNEGL